jgi:UDP-glucose 4-epimerase
MKKILVTGGAGFIGYHLSKILSEEDENEVHIVDDLSHGKKDEYFKQLIEKRNIIFYEADLTSLDSYSKIENKYDQIYHLAAVVGVRRVVENPVLTVRVNTLSTIYLLDYVKEMKNKPKVLFTSSCENYAGSIKMCNVEIPTPENVPLCIEDIYNPRWSYGGSKILGEIACLHYSKKYNFEVKIVRYHNIYGPRMGTCHVIPEFITRILNKENPFLLYGGNQYRTFCYVDDTAKMTINVMNKSKSTLYNIGSSSEETEIRTIAKILFKIANFYPELVEMGAPEGSIQHRKPDMSKMKSESLQVDDVNLNEGLQKTYNWYKRSN